VDLGSFTEASTKQYDEARASGAQFELTLSENVFVNADPRALETIYSNLVSNGLKYGGSPPQLCISVTRSSTHGVLEVRDFGHGIEGDESGRLFDPFVRGQGELVKRRPGIGLGLYLVAQLSRSMGAEVSARNVPDGKGFVVSISLPLVARREED
jgi:signal transduction histidine kinase